MNESDLHGYQIEAVKHIMENPKCGLFLEMGLGKTVSTLTAIKKLMYEELEVSKVLVIAPKRVAESVWDAECEKWQHLHSLKIIKISGSPKQRKLALAQEADIYTLGRDNVTWLCSQYGGSSLPFDMLVIDELSSFKNPNSLRFKALRKTVASIPRVVGLTGTPAPNGLINLWSQMYLLDMGERLGRYISHFRANFFKPGARNGNIVYDYKVTAEGEKAIFERIGDICMSMGSKDYLDMPERIDNIIDLQLGDEVKKKYDDFEKELVLDLFESEEDPQIYAVNAAALSNKLLQFANGAVYDEDKNYHVVHDVKIEALKEIVEDANGKSVLIAWTYRHDLKRLQKALKKYKPRELKTDQDIKDWNAGKIQVMMMHPASGGHGLNLQSGGNIIVWFGQTWSLELEQQFNARLHRQGQTQSVIVHKLVAKGTLDEDVIRAQTRKEAKQNALMEAVKSRVAKYIR